MEDTPTFHLVKIKIEYFRFSFRSLLYGPPGLGKTTLAHVVANHAGYKVVEINASDDREYSAIKILYVQTELKPETEIHLTIYLDYIFNINFTKKEHLISGSLPLDH